MFETFELQLTENNPPGDWYYVQDAGYTPPDGYEIVSICGAGTGWPYASVNPIVLSTGVVFVWYYKATTGAGANYIRLYITLQKIK